ncbi:MAG: TonB-dependent receptor [Acidobacteria bacterium]|nr:TonB-dependent receptor [Acidobacteriota bacterium]
MLRFAFRVPLIRIGFLGFSVWAVAQTPLASISGGVQSADGSPLPGTVIQAKNISSGRSYSTRTDAQGKFQLGDLSPGRYELQVSRSGFIRQTDPSLEIAPGQSLARDFVLEIDSERDEARRANAADASQPRAASAVSRINESQLAGLPLNGRSYSQLATLQAGITDPTAASGSRGISSGNLTVSGGRSNANLFLLDGTNIMDTRNQAPRSAAGVQLGSDAVYQVQVFSTNYGAEYGRGSGGVLNSITRSGSNEFHLTLFEFLRNSKLDARNFFDYDPTNPTQRSDPPPFKRNQFGFTLTGPVKKEKTFFMVSYEGLRDRLSNTDLSYFPDEKARLGEITDAEGRVSHIPVDPAVRPYLDMFPIPNDLLFPRGIGRNFAPQFLPTDENFFTVRVDQKLSDRDSFFARYTFDDATSYSESNSHLFKLLNRSRQQYLTLAGSHIFNLNVLNSFRFGFTRPVPRTENVSYLSVPPDLFFVPGASQFGQLQIPGITPFGPNPAHPSGNEMNSFQFANDLFVQRGPHALQFGFQVHRYQWFTYSKWNEGSTWSFNSIESFLSDKGKPGTSLTVARPGSDNHREFRQTYAGFYAQDQYAVNASLQLNLGLRYEFVTQFTDLRGKIVFLPDLLRSTEIQRGSFMKDNPSLRSFAPRFGISWVPWSSRRTVLRWGVGIYYEQILGNVASTRTSSAPFYNIAINSNFDALHIFPHALKAAVGMPDQVAVMDYGGMKTPTVYRYDFAIQKELAGGWRVEANYVGARGNHLARRYEANLYSLEQARPDGSVFFLPNSGPINPAFGSINVIGTDGQSFYNALQLSANKSLSSGLSLQANYTFSKSVDDNSVGVLDVFGQYPFLRTTDRGLSDFDVRHRLAVNYFYSFPFGGGQRWWPSGFLSKVLGRWRLGGILSFRSGIPFTPTVQLRDPNYLFEPQRPNLVPGRSKNPAQGVSSGCGQIAAGTKLEAPDLYFDPCAFEAPSPGTLGNLGRNTLISPSVFSLDVSLQREFLLDAKRRFQFRADFFNLPNHTNFSRNILNALLIFSGSSGRRNSTAGRIGSTATTSRQVQLALRFSF